MTSSSEAPSIPSQRAGHAVEYANGTSLRQRLTQPFSPPRGLVRTGAAGRPARSYRSDERTMRDPRAERAAIADLLDLQEGRLGVPLLDDTGIRTLLSSGPRIALVGASNDPRRP